MEASVTAAGAGASARLRLVAAILVGVVGPEVFIVQPGFVQGLVEKLGFDDQSAGYAASIEVWGITATTLLMTFFAHRFNWRKVIAVSLLLVAVSNALCIGVHDRHLFVLLRFLAGAGAGSLISLSFTTVGLTENPDRNFGYLIMWVLLYGAVVLYLMPAAYAATGMNGVLLFFALFPLAALPLVRAFPENGETAAAVEADAVDMPAPLKVTALAAMFAYFIAQGVAWAYLFLIGTGGGLSDQRVATALTLSQVAGVAGALLPALIGHRFGRWRPLTVGIVGGAVALAFLIGRFESLTFTLLVCTYNFFWNMTHPFLLGSMASFDRRGRVVVYAVALQMLGLAIGPALAASVIAPSHYERVNWLAIAFFAVSWVCILPPVLVQQSRASARQIGWRPT
ncbi:MAG TPA: MFS transporter [Steroidobacteraceae bacterium]|nr:MFS transporter [Steroidobacteraceae bacterium]